MHILMYRANERDSICSVMGIFFTRKQAKKVRDSLIAWDRKKYPQWTHRSEQTKSCYTIQKQSPFKHKKHKDPFEAK